jgi:hypothetical protein
MQQLHEIELEDAKQRIAASGRNPEDFDFRLEFQEPDPDGGGMFTVYYDITATNTKTGKSAGFVGGIGMGWVDAFEEALKQGEFD